MKKIIYLCLTSLILVFGCSTHVENEIRVTELEYTEILPIVKRAEWGWQPLEHGLPEQEISKITIHHGGVDFPPDKDPVEHLVNLQKWSRSDEKNWIDIPYHFMIDLEGKIYETRPINYPGATNTEYDPTGHALICVMGNYENQTLSEQQLVSLIKMCVYLVQRFNVPVDDIAGHKDYSAITACPGKDIYKYLEDGTIRNRVAELIGKSKK